MLKTGATLVRQWRGHTHTVLVRDDGFEYDGQRYRSLTWSETLACTDAPCAGTGRSLDRP
jgi:hypothetical protein